MSTFHLHNKPWTRLHDLRAFPLKPSVPQITGFNALADLLDICATRPANTKFKASGRHWGLSEAAVSDDEPIETNWPGSENVVWHSGFDLNLDSLCSDALFHYPRQNVVHLQNE